VGFLSNGYFAGCAAGDLDASFALADTVEDCFVSVSFA